MITTITTVKKYVEKVDWRIIGIQPTVSPPVSITYA